MPAQHPPLPAALPAQGSFIQYIAAKPNSHYLLAAVLTGIIGWWVFKQFYPYPNLIFDSYYYISSAVSKASVGPWPMGYSWFIRFIGVFSHNPNFLLAVQFILLQLSFLWFFFTVRYLFQPGKYPSLLLFLFLQLNPIYIYTSNLILSDTLFTALSICWFTQLIWLIFRPRPYMLLTHTLLLLAVFSIRYNALYYPLIGAVAFLLSRQKRWFIITGIALPVLLVIGFIQYTTHTMQKKFGVKQFSPFGSWKVASNALYVYEHIYSNTDSNAIPQRFQPLDKRVRAYFNGPHYKADILVNDPTWGSFYMWLHPSPLIQHMFSIYGPDKMNLNFVKFAPMGPLYGDYGAYIIKKHPLAFARYFVAPNVLRYINPPQEVLVDDVNPFSLRRDYLGQPAIQWFHLKTIRVPTARIAFRTQLFYIYPAFCTFLHYLFVLSAIGFILLKGYRHVPAAARHGVWVAMALWLVDFGFSLTAAAVVLRYQLFIMAIEFSFAALFIEWLYQLSTQQNKQSPAVSAFTNPFTS